MWDEGQVERFADRLRKDYRAGSDTYRAACDLLMVIDSVRFYEQRVRDLTEENEQLRNRLKEIEDGKNQRVSIHNTSAEPELL